MKADFHNYSTKSFSWIKDHNYKQYKEHPYQLTYRYSHSNEKANKIGTFMLLATLDQLRKKYKKRLLWLICKEYDNSYEEIRYKLA